MKKLLLLSLFLVLFLSGCSLSIPLLKAAKTLKPEEAKAAAEKFINENLLPANIKANIKNVTLQGELYNISLEVNGTEYTSYMTKDGTMFFQSGLDMVKVAAENAAKNAGEQAQPSAQPSAQETTVPRADKPKAELFVMTHCPYGLQAEKGFLPAIQALGNKVDAKIRFVHYFMHGDKEEQETNNQVCIREEQAAKFNSYLSCFTVSGDSAACQATAGINKSKLASCVSAKAKDYYKIDSGLSQGYGVQGSPTLIINGVQSQAGRDAASYLAGICAAFTNAPAECGKQLSTAAPSSGFGSGTAAAGGSAAACGQ